MLGTDEIRLGLYSSRAFDIIDVLIATYLRAAKSYEAKCTVKCMKLETAPNREIILKFDRNQLVYIFQRSIWNELNTAMEARQQLVKLLKYVVKYKLDGSCFKSREFTVERMCDKMLVVTSDEFKTLCDLLASRRSGNPECAKALIGEPLNEVEAGLETMKRDEIAKIRHETADLVNKLELDAWFNAERAAKEFDEKIAEMYQLRSKTLDGLQSELNAECMKIYERREARIREIEKKYA